MSRKKKVKAETGKEATTGVGKSPVVPTVTPKVAEEVVKIATKEPETVTFFHKFPQWACWVKPPIDTVQNGIRVRQPGIKIQFKNHEFRTNDPEIIIYLRKHPEYNNRGIYENQPASPQAIASMKKVISGASSTVSEK